jgi:hypothetical protein
MAVAERSSAMMRVDDSGTHHDSVAGIADVLAENAAAAAAHTVATTDAAADSANLVVVAVTTPDAAVERVAIDMSHLNNDKVPFQRKRGLTGGMWDAQMPRILCQSTLLQQVPGWMLVYLKAGNWPLQQAKSCQAVEEMYRLEAKMARSSRMVAV